MCILKNKWLDTVPTIKIEPTRRSLYDVINNYFTFNRQYKPEDGFFNDCLYNTKKWFTKIPNDCYWKDMSVHRLEELYKWFDVYGQDVLYTFDFVLFNDKFS